MRLRTRKRRRAGHCSGSPGATEPTAAPIARRIPVGWVLCAALGAAAGLYGATALDAARRFWQLPSLASPTPTEGQPRDPAWVATAPGRIEPVSGEVRIGSLMLARVAEIFVKVGDQVGRGDLLIRLEDEEARARVTSADAQAVARKRERDGVPVTGATADRRQAEDRVAAAERSLAVARHDLDRLSASRAAAGALSAAREALTEAQLRLERARDELARRKAVNTKAPGPLDSALTIARAELSAAEAMFEKTRVRAPFAGTVLQLPVRVGETVAPAAERVLVALGDASRLRARVDLDQRNGGKVFVGQSVLVRSAPFADAFKGKVAAIAPALGPPQTLPPGRRRPHEGSVLEVLVELQEAERLMPGMQVDVFFLAADAGK